jgi:hypothetical protein
MKKDKPAKRIVFIIVGVFVAFILVAFVSVFYPPVSEEQAEQELAQNLFQYVQHLIKRVGYGSDNITHQIIIWYPLVEDPSWVDWDFEEDYWDPLYWNFGEEPLKVWWFEDGDWNEITSGKQVEIQSYLDNYHNDNEQSIFARFGFSAVEKQGWSYQAKIIITISFGLNGNSNCSCTFFRGPFGKWYKADYLGCIYSDPGIRDNYLINSP